MNPGPGDTEVHAGLTIFFSTKKERTPHEVPQKFEITSHLFLGQNVGSFF